MQRIRVVGVCCEELAIGLLRRVQPSGLMIGDGAVEQVPCPGYVVADGGFLGGEFGRSYASRLLAIVSRTVKC
jgi:hypothetical protein